jgi:HK97 family phage major capsid protein
MPTYLDRLHAQFDEIRAGVDDIVNRAADENRDVSDDEQAQVDRDQTRMAELSQSITHYTELAEQSNQVAVMRGRVAPTPATSTTRTEPRPEAYDVLTDFPDAGSYAVTLHRAVALRDPDAVARIERATAHQVLAENPGLIPRPVLGPVLNYLDTSRPFIQSIVRRPLPAGTFDRPRITQHVKVGKQAAEKTLTESQVLKADKITTTASTYAGHLNISRQDIKWTQPAIMQLVFDDFAAMYAQVTDDDAADQWLASITSPPVAIASATVADLYAAIYGASVTALAYGPSLTPDTLWVSPDVWATLGGATTTQDAPVFPTFTPGSQSGNALGLKLVVDGNFPDSTMVTGPSKAAEWYEDVDGLMQVAEPDVLGQLVGYAGFGAFLNLVPGAFTKFTPPVVGP